MNENGAGGKNESDADGAENGGPNTNAAAAPELDPDALRAGTAVMGDVPAGFRADAGSRMKIVFPTPANLWPPSGTFAIAKSSVNAHE